MARINCHSAFKHYEMFHSRGGDVINIGSNNTTIFNCGGSHLGGGFWGGFGLGLGNAFGSLFSGGFGMGGFGFPLFGGLGNFGSIWSNPLDNRNSRVSNSSPNTTACNCDDKEPAKNIDNAKFADLTGQLKDLQQKENVTPEEIQAVIDKVQDARNKEDGIEGVNDKKTYDNLLKTLNNMKEKAEKAKAAPVKQPATQAIVQPGDDDGAQKTAAPSDNEPTVTIDGNPVKLSDLTDDYIKGLSDEDKLALLNDPNITPELRAKIKKSFYKPGLDNVKESELNETTLKNLIEVIDVSEITDFKNVKVGKVTKDNNDNWTIQMIEANGKTRNINYVQVEVVDGEIIFHGKNNAQHYVLQKDKDNKLHLMQYKYHDGYGTPDVRG